jgi:large subunit ribosomal protein L10
MATLAEKKKTVEEISSHLQDSDAVYITNYEGMSVAEINDLRREFYRANITFKVYKNTLVKRAMEDIGGFEDLYPHLVEQNAFVFVDEELAAPAKIFKKFDEEIEKPQFKAAILNEDYYDENELSTLAAMKSKKEVIGDIAGLLLAPISNITSALQASGQNIVGVLETIADEKQAE